jgi:hypothetical protein
MRHLAIATVCTADWFAGFIPLMVYSALRANPGAHILIWVCGKLPEYVKAAMKRIEAGYRIYEDQFKGFPMKVGTTNALRHVLPETEFAPWDIVFISDVDFIFVKQSKSIADYYGDLMDKMRLPCAGARGPKSWEGPEARIAEGTFCFKNPEWFNKTRGAREYYADLMREGQHDGIDNHPAGSYREYGEVMLHRICKMSGIETPEKENCYPNGERADAHYRQIHIGDFKFPRRIAKPGKMDRIMPTGNIVDYLELREESGWKKIVDLVRSNNEKISKLLQKLDIHIKTRLARPCR